MRRVLVAALAVVSVAALGVALAPLVILRPFSAQSPSGIQAAWTLRHFGPAATAGLAGVALVLAAAWVRAAKGRRARAALAGAALLVPALLGATVARWSPFEAMFAPLPRPRFVAASEAGLADSDMVLGVALAGGARAFPVRAMAYHHVVTEVIAGEPVVATY